MELPYREWTQVIPILILSGTGQSKSSQCQSSVLRLLLKCIMGGRRIIPLPGAAGGKIPSQAPFQSQSPSISTLNNWPCVERTRPGPFIRLGRLAITGPENLANGPYRGRRCRIRPSFGRFGAVQPKLRCAYRAIITITVIWKSTRLGSCPHHARCFLTAAWLDWILTHVSARGATANLTKVRQPFRTTLTYLGSLSHIFPSALLLGLGRQRSPAPF